MKSRIRNERIIIYGVLACLTALSLGYVIEARKTNMLETYSCAMFKKSQASTLCHSGTALPGGTCLYSYDLKHAGQPEDGILINSLDTIQNAMCISMGGDLHYLYDDQGNYIR